MDIFYDHLLALDWARHHEQTLAAYSASVYAQIKGRLNKIPAPAHRALQLMTTEDWFLSYAQFEGIADVLARMSRRARQPNPLAGGQQELAADTTGFAQDFGAWLADATQFAASWRAAA